MNVFNATCLAAAVLVSVAPARADDYGQYPAPSPYSPMPRSFLARRCIVIPPYGPLPVRIYTTPQLGPYYNVPPYAVIAPY